MKFHFVITLFLIIILSACAAKKVAVEYADTMIESQVERRLPLYENQKKALAVDIDKFLMSKKKLAQEMLPLIDQIALDDPKKIEPHYRKLEGFYQDISYDFSKLMAKYMARLDQKQQKEFFETMTAENKNIERKDAKDRREQIEDRLEKVFGSVTAGQKLLLTDYQFYFDERTKVRLQKREKLHQSFKEILSQEASPTAKEELILGAFENYQVQSMADSKNLEIIQKFIPTLTMKQKESFREKTRELKEILNYFIETAY